jgi:beta-1,4-mannooligosaccharide/beta-1,4-mannosyl-N-acetylglucosamine phosphorylase
MLRRHPAGPILTRYDIPPVPPLVVDVTAVFNSGAIRWKGRDILLLRIQTRGRETVMMVAESRDGVHFDIRPRLVQIDGLERVCERIYHVYDPRLTAIEGVVYVVAAVDTDTGCHLAIARTVDFERLELVSFSPAGLRNGVLFPERIGGRFMRLERPNRVPLQGCVASGSEIVLSASDDLVQWELVAPVMQGRPHYWDELIGSGPPPVKTRAGWLHLYHGIAMHFSAPIYQAGVALLDLEQPQRVIARGRNNILEPRELYELVGQVPNVVFPCGWIVDRFDADGFATPDSPVRVYYGAADTVLGLATTTIGELIEDARVE